MFGGRLRRSGTNATTGTNTSSQNSSPDNITSSEYARKCRDLMKLHRDLSRLCAGILLDMPRLTVIGSQSAGKSSLVEAVSGISVPRDSGTCTRCPMECSMSTTDKAWSCRISLRIVTGDGQYPTTQFGPLITDRKDVEIWIRRAQAAILNPNVAETEFLTKTEKELKKSSNALQFSKNVVCVHVSDPDLTDLSFVDLPGLIQNSNDDDITLIKDLVVDAISGSNTLILVTIPMSDDMQNQAAVRLARDADPAGERTIGVLTKPDGLSDGATGHLQSWKDVIEGKLHPLKHGYYCVRLPNDAERSRYKFRNDFQRFAAQFFETTTPWNTIADRSRFGVPNFVASISGLLVQLIEKNLPELRRRVEQLLAECVEELKGLPTALTTNDASTEVFLRITQFCQDFRSTVFGEQKRNLVQDNRRRYNLFKEDIYRSRPNFAPYLNSHHYLRPSDPEADRFPASGPVIDLPQVKQAIALGWELPTHLPFDATKDYILGFTRLWNQPAVSCFQDVFATTSEFIKTLMAQHFGQFRSLEKHVAFVVQAELNRCKTETTDALTKMLELESIPVFTQNNEFLLSERVRWLQLYYNSQFQHKTLHELYRNNDDYDALSVMADVRAYFQVAHKRVIDYVPLTIEHTLHQSLASELQRSLFESLLQGNTGATDCDMMEALLAEDPVIAKKRELLEDRRKRLRLIKERLDAFGDDD